MMHKKQYIQFADMIAEHMSYLISLNVQIDAVSELQSIQGDLIRIFKADNPNFDEDVFNQYIEKRVRINSHQ